MRITVLGLLMLGRVSLGLFVEKQVKKLEHRDSVSCIAVSNRNRWCLYSSSHDGVIKIWDLRKNLCLEELKNQHFKKYN
jgi:WD40 repeat protein